jgi:hypothetical protein
VRGNQHRVASKVAKRSYQVMSGAPIARTEHARFSGGMKSLQRTVASTDSELDLEFQTKKRFVH